MTEEKPMTFEDSGRVESNFYAKMRKFHSACFVLLILALGAWAVTRIALANLPGETQALITRYFYITGWCIWGLTGLFMITALLSAVTAIQSSTSKAHTAVLWAAYIAFMCIIAYFFTAFRISAIGLHGGLTGLSNSSDKAAYLLMRFYPYLPVTPVNLVIGGMGNPTKYLGMMPSSSGMALSYAVLLGISFVSLFLRRKRRIRIIMVLIFAAAGIGFSYLIATGFRDVLQNLPGDVARAAPLVNYFFSCLSILLAGIVFYTTVRSLSYKRATAENKGGAVLRPLPLGAFWLLVIFMFLAPSLADLENVHSLERNGRAIIESQN